MIGLSLGTLLQRFFHERLSAQRNASPNTISSYRDTWRLLLNYLTSQTGRTPVYITVEDLTAETVLAFLDYLEEGRMNGVRSRNQRLAALKAFFHFAIFADPSILGQAQRVIEIPTKRYTRPLMGYLTHEEMDAVLAAPDRNTSSGRRYYALLLFMYNTGARVSEVIGVNVEHLGLASPTQVMLYGKGGKMRIVPIWPDTARILDALLKETGIQHHPDASVFANSRGERLTRSGVTHILRTVAERAAESCTSLANRSVSPHTIRHTTAMHLLQSGVDIGLIRMWLGHVALDTTHQYIEADMEMKRKALEKGGITTPGTAGVRWNPTDELMDFLDKL